MFGMDEAQDNYQQAKNEDTASLGHEVLAGGGAFFAMHEFEKHQRNEGKEVDHGLAKEMLAGFAGAGVDYLAETKGEEFVRKEEGQHKINKAKKEAKERAEQLYDQQYGDQPNYNPNNTEPPQHLQNEFGEHHYKKGGHRRDD